MYALHFPPPLLRPRPWALMDPAVQSSDVVVRLLARNSLSEQLAEDIDKSVKEIIDKAYEMAKTHSGQVGGCY